MQKYLSLATLALGLLLLAYMIPVEGEPGAIPLALVAVGAVWSYAARRPPRSR
jgi:hypothetical protein